MFVKLVCETLPAEAATLVYARPDEKRGTCLVGVDPRCSIVLPRDAHTGIARHEFELSMYSGGFWLRSLHGRLRVNGFLVRDETGLDPGEYRLEVGAHRFQLILGRGVPVGITPPITSVGSSWRPTQATAAYHGLTWEATASVPWNGLRGLGAARVVETVRGSPGASAWDLGQGVIAFDRPHRYPNPPSLGFYAVELLSGELRWTTLRHAPLATAGGRVLWTGRGGGGWRGPEGPIVEIDPRTGAVRPLEGLLWDGPGRRLPFAVCDRWLGKLTVLEDDDWGSEKPDERRLAVYDLERGVTRMDIALPKGDGFSLVPTEDRVYTLEGGASPDRRSLAAGTLVARSLSGEVLFSHRYDGARLVGVSDGRLFVARPRAVDVLSGSTGLKTAELALARPHSSTMTSRILVTREVLLFTVGARIAAFDRHTLEPIWSVARPYSRLEFSTADALLVSDPSGLEAWDPRTGETLSRSGTSSVARPLLTAGAVAFLGPAVGPRFEVVEEVSS